MKKIIILIAFIGLSLNLTSCGKQIANKSSRELSVANLQLNNRQFEEAISTLENAISKSPTNEELQIKLAHAYAGAGGFESVSFAVLIKDIVQIKADNEVRSILNAIREKLEKVPTLTNVQRARLDQAISLYSQLGLDPYKTSKENNFKWASLHTYRLVITLKDVSTLLSDVYNSSEMYTKNELQSILIKKFDLIAKDFYKSYTLYKNSFTKLQKIAQKFDQLIQGTLGSKEFKLKLDSKAKTYESFIKDLIANNKEIVTRAIVQINEKLNILDFDSSVQRIFKDFKENKEDVRKRAVRLELLAKLFIENVILKNETKHNELKDIFTQDLQKEAELALKMALVESSVNPIRDFIQSKNTEIATIVEAFNILSSEYKKSNIATIADPDVRALVDYINKEEVKLLVKNFQRTGYEIGAIEKAAADEILLNTEETSNRLKEQFSQDSEELNDEISPYATDLEDALESNDDEMNENASRIIRETRDFVEQ